MFFYLREDERVRRCSRVLFGISKVTCNGSIGCKAEMLAPNPLGYENFFFLFSLKNRLTVKFFAPLSAFKG